MTALRTCIGSAKFGIERHEAPPDDFPIQPSQKDGLGRLCKTHWNQYTNALRKAALAREAADGDPVASDAIAEREVQLPETLAEVETPDGQAALEAAAKAAQVARRGGARTSKKAAAGLLPSAGSQGDAG